MTIEEKINLGVQKFLQGKGTLTEIRKQVGLPNTIEMSQKLTEMGYFMYTGAKYTSVVGLKFDYKLASKDDKLTKILSIHGKNAFELSYYLYNDATIYLQRKYDRYLEYCRVYEESYILLQVKNGKIITNNNTVLNI